MAHPNVENETPFAFDMMGLSDEDGRPALLLVVKATFVLGDAGLKLADMQTPVQWSAKPWGRPGESSDKYEPESALSKVATDVALIGHAYPPQKGATESLVALQVGPLKKAVRVIGERTWFKSMGRVTATKPLPFDKLPLTWERAFGGWDRTDAGKPSFEPRNPVGVGFRSSPRHFEEGLKLPNLEDPATAPLREFGQRVVPAGFGFTSPHWQPRAKYGGTYDEAWNRTRKPLVPKDFDRRFFNAAAPGLTAPGYLRGDEPVIIAGASPRGRLSFSLPGQATPVVTLELQRGETSKPPMNLDTVILDADADQVLLIWRGHAVLDDGLHDVRSLTLTAEGTSLRKVP
ncbi:DUF2169 family type VI secretion system accessory protein [Myxococcus xanthus]|uniref:DUF2169 domain-containing protein n=1 Tax=Myxococcus xanthus TaxID=34 RepID=A0A7Y4IMG1_MYXXA|nr:DUF2169 domain-containing protein [Myxococcus xanthus]NOJ81801.1 DUF2169 domain-containing protein [Myxococcus xanthus]NOJ87526.1 DUF2169 domain-containing protein [Myxococcus xanthus]